jgi:hypothetical protein
MHKRFRNRDLIQTHKTVKTQQKKPTKSKLNSNSIQTRTKPSQNDLLPNNTQPMYNQSVLSVCVGAGQQAKRAGHDQLAHTYKSKHDKGESILSAQTSLNPTPL